MPKVELAQKRGDVSDYVDAVIQDDGRLQVIRNSFGPGDYETEVTAAVAKEDKDRLLLALLERVFRGNLGAVEEFRDLARSKDIPVSWFRWP